MSEDLSSSGRAAVPLNETERQTKFKVQTTALYAALGEYVVAFEMAVFSARQLLLTITSSDMLSQQLIMPAYAGLTADPIRAVLLSTCATAIKLSPHYDESERVKAQAILEQICSRFALLTQTRNEIVHGTWFIGWASPFDVDFSTADGFKPKNTKTGVTQTNLSRKVEDFNLLIDDCREMTDLINRMMALNAGHKFSKNFKWAGKKVTLEESQWTFVRKSQKCA